MADRSLDVLRLLNRPEGGRRERRRGLGSALLALLVLGALAEAVLRTMPSLLSAEHRIALQRERARLPRGMRDLHETVYTPDFTYTAVSDDFGFPNAARPARVDVVVLGGSLATGEGVEPEGRFAARLAAALPDTGVWNLALADSSPREQYGIWTDHAVQHRLRAVIAVLAVGGDVDAALAYEDFLTLPSEPYEPPRERPGSSYALSHLWYTSERLLAPGRLTEELALPSGESVLLSRDVQASLAVGLTRADAPRLGNTLLDPLLRIATEARASGTAFVLVLLPSKEELYGAAREPAVLRAIGDVRAQLGDLRVLDLYEPLARADGSPFFAVDPHLNARGNRVVADALVEWLRAVPPVPGL